ncbi:hypothetical protein GXP67_18455 [Rhodocytophaga rosea]|uniref:TonB C-terminal domain-containing protein n=1 Tax=Rhodocytophaga rosea TaxID=2704465 RepID=A0A6C0GLF5_9BACT|nr:hypothetical protein [Rhodocytophaga rosea]QHT68483.1 hypothetical protein GXP67_18455 [Rhodocytophaga rosea]
MKTMYAMIFLGLFSLGIQNASAQLPVSISTNTSPENTYPSLTQQIAQLISSPIIQDEEDGVVALSFKVDKNSRISNIKVYTENEALNQHIILSLKGKQLNGQGYERKQYRLRIHFAASEILAARYASF